ncbi:MAG TPA: GNAT family N-acetyltransferase [Marmoricola sp.]
MALPDVVSTHRLRLVLVTADEARAGLAGERRPEWHPDYPRQDDLDAFSMVRGPDPWGPRHIVRGWDGLVCGSIGFHGPPVERDGVPETEIGYGLVAEARGHGLASEAVTALLALTDAEGVRIVASVEPENAPSIRVLAKCGFTELRAPTDDGLLVLARPLPRQP